MSKVWLETHTTKKICSIISPATLLPRSLLARHMISTTTRVGGFLQRWLLTSIWVDLVGQIYPPIYPNSLGIRQRTLICSELSGVLQARVTSRNCGYITITKNPSQIVSVLVDKCWKKIPLGNNQAKATGSQLEQNLKKAFWIHIWSGPVFRGSSLSSWNGLFLPLHGGWDFYGIRSTWQQHCQWGLDWTLFSTTIQKHVHFSP